ncbi:MAG: DUF4411 family protein [Anaerolineaceae bacterium]|nr:DUF4411 family protein [Anaerolineaceae bacterium]
MRYSIDTSSLIDWHRYYPGDIFEQLSEMFTEACDSSILVAHEYVLEELSRRDDELLQWAKDRDNFILPLDEDVQNGAKRIIEEYGLNQASHSSRIVADPFVVSLAKCHGLTVVTEEKRGARESPKIPFICQSENVKCLNILDFMREMGWKFN